MYEFWINILKMDLAGMDLQLVTGPTSTIVSVALRYVII
jgi:hypothetical protein